MSYYGQNEEDEYIQSMIDRYELDTPKLIVDLGAFDGVFLSNSRHFLEEGWKGLLVEANTDNWKQLIENSHIFNAENHNVRAVNAIVAGEYAKYKKIEGDHPSLTRYEIDLEGDYFAMTYHQLMTEYFEKDVEIGILSIDIELLDTEVLEDALRYKNKPDWIIIESNTQQMRRDQIELLLEADYYICNILDVNIIAVKSSIANKWIQ